MIGRAAKARNGVRRGAQRGAALILSAVIITTVMAFAVLVTSRSSVGELQGALRGSDALQALLSAETGIQRTAKRISQGLTTCVALSALNPIETITYPAGVSTILNARTTDFDGVTMLTTPFQCRLEATATVTTRNVTRKFSQIVDTRLFDLPSGNLDFNTGSPPTGWTLSGTSAAYFRTLGGPDGVAPACTQSAYLVKTASVAVTTIGAQALRFNAYAAAATNFTFSFNKRYLRSGAGDTNAANNVQFRLTDSAPVVRNAATTPLGAPTNYPGLPSADPPYAACGTNYTSSTTANLSIPIAVVNPITTLGFTMNVRANGGNKEVFMDNIVVNAPAIPSGGTYLRILRWRECVPSPNNCV